ncbi:MAG: alpha/beta hydrolase [FCB group bacterium]|jgi:acetyl esterase/lipase|nr:alpha/beta hydrolase [FCB group bacterium]
MKIRNTWLLSILICFGLALSLGCAPQTDVAPAAETPADATAAAEPEAQEVPIPKGYASEAEIMQAFGAGQLNLIAENPPIPDEVKSVPDVEYFNVDGNSLKLDLYLPRESKGAVPALVFIHGGGWSGGNRKDYAPYTIEFARRGYVTASISYRLRGVALYPACVKDVKCAIKFLRANAEKYGIDPNRIAALGGSAGGHLSMMIGYAAGAPEFDQGCFPDVSDAVQAVVDLYGPTDLTTPFARTHGTVTSFIGQPYEAAMGAYVQASPITWVNAGDPPTLIFQGTIDTLVTPDQSDLLADKLKATGIDYVYEKYEGWPHTMDKAQPVFERTKYVIDKFMKKHLGGPTPAPAK